MNKIVVLKFKEEFDYWLKGGSLWYKYGNDKEWRFLETDSSEINHVFNPYNVKILINDELSEFRKAVADGEVVQYYVDGFIGWQDVKSIKQPCMHPDSFRIKSEEPKFKEDAWVRERGNIYKFSDLLSDWTYELLSKSCELWEPKAGEFCWFWNESETHPTLAVFTNKSLGLYYSDISNDGFDFCEPFIGELPTSLKG